jgi:hypothetical protein
MATQQKPEDAKLSVHLNVWVSEETAAAIEKARKRERRRLSEWLRFAVEDRLRKKPPTP